MFSGFISQRQSLVKAATAVTLLLAATTSVQSQHFCQGELGEAGWACESLSPIPPEVFAEFFPLPGSPDPANPVKYKQIAGEPAFDEATGARNSNSAVFVLTEGTYFCMVAESQGEASLFDAPEGMQCTSRLEWSWSQRSDCCCYNCTWY